MDSVFILWYVHAPDTDYEEAFLIGVYRTEEDAEAAIERLRDRKGFKDAPQGFQISPCKLNEDQWTEGNLVD
jgi:homoserine kinase type II